MLQLFLARNHHRSRPVILGGAAYRAYLSRGIAFFWQLDSVVWVLYVLFSLLFPLQR